MIEDSRLSKSTIGYPFVAPRVLQSSVGTWTERDVMLFRYRSRELFIPVVNSLTLYVTRFLSFPCIVKSLIVAIV